MPRPRTLRLDVLASGPTSLEGQDTTSLPFVNDPAGENYSLTPQQLGTQTAAIIENYRINNYKKLQSRYPVVQLGDTGDEYITGLETFKSVAGSERQIRWLQTKVQFLANNVWVDFTGPTLAIGQWARVSWTSWSNYLLFTDTVSGIYKIDFSTNSFSLIVGSPIAQKITSFGSRVVASNVTIDGDTSAATRIQWSVKDNSDDWSGLGSGYEDLQSAPGGKVDAQLGVYPVNDIEAMVVRSSSVWLMAISGYVDAPFNFRYLYNVQCDAPNSIAMSPGGVFFLSRNDVVLCDSQNYKAISQAVKSKIFANKVDYGRVSGVYDSNTGEYLLFAPFTTIDTTKSTIWHYKVAYDAWTHDSIPLEIRGIAETNFKLGSSISELLNRIIDQIGTIASLGVKGTTTGIVFFTGDNKVYNESATAVQELNYNNDLVDVVGLIRLGSLSQDPTLDSSLIQVQLDFAGGNTVAPTFLVEVSGDEFLSEQLSFSPTKSSNRTSLTRNLLVLFGLVRRNELMVQLTTTKGNGLILNGIYLDTNQGSRIHF